MPAYYFMIIYDDGNKNTKDLFITRKYPTEKEFKELRELYCTNEFPDENVYAIARPYETASEFIFTEKMKASGEYWT